VIRDLRAILCGEVNLSHHLSLSAFHWGNHLGLRSTGVGDDYTTFVRDDYSNFALRRHHDRLSWERLCRNLCRRVVGIYLHSLVYPCNHYCSRLFPRYSIFVHHTVMIRNEILLAHIRIRHVLSFHHGLSSHHDPAFLQFL
jgi:glycosyltransferase involved in cell wall biosynthesis